MNSRCSTLRHPSRRGFIAGGAATGVVGWSGWGHAADTAEISKFREDVLALLRTERPAIAFELAAKPDAIKSGSKEISLGNLYDLVRDMRGRVRQVRILEFIDAGISATASLELG
jgi:hypothetical protein